MKIRCVGVHRRMGRESYPDGEIWTDLSDPPEFLRLFDLKIDNIEYRWSADRTVWV